MNKLHMRFLCGLLLLLAMQTSGWAQTISEKKAGSVEVGSDLSRDMQKTLAQLNQELLNDHRELHELYAQVYTLYQNNAPDDTYRGLLDRINQIRTDIQVLENNWREMAAQSGNQESYALFHQPESTLGQLIIDYGSQNYVYVMSPDISSLKLSVASNIPIPRASWNEMIELILSQNGVGIKQLNPYLRQLYLIRQDRSGIKLITNNRDDLEFLDPDVRVCFVLSPEPSEVRRVWSFLDKFTNPNSTVLQMIGRDILVVATVSEIQDLLKLYDFAASNRGDKEYKIKNIAKVDAEEMAKILAAIFDQLTDAPRQMESSGRPPGGGPPGHLGGPGAGKASFDGQKDRSRDSNEVNGLKIIPLKAVAQAIFLVGTREEIRRAEEIIDQVECQVGEAREKVPYWYTCKHSDPEELAQVLEKIYNLMVQNRICCDGQNGPQGPQGCCPPTENRDCGEPENEPSSSRPPSTPQGPFPTPFYQNDFYQQGGYVVNPTPVEPRKQAKPEANRNRSNFIVDLKTGAIVMVVEADLLQRMKDLIKKLDVPKKMVQIEALIFEKRLTRNDNFGLNLLRFGDVAYNVNRSGVLWNTNCFMPSSDIPVGGDNRGVFEFILNFKKHKGIPAFDLAYRFLLRQEDVQINANPTVVTLNQVPARISIVDEISINTGVTYFTSTNGVTNPQSSFTRAQYGITISVTPTIHMMEEDGSLTDEGNYVTLETDITFDTFQRTIEALAGQPEVTRRQVTNQVRIPDGQTVVIGGLRRKNIDDGKEMVPYLGELPCIGRLFSNSQLRETTVELFIFLTPKIITNPEEDFDRLRCEEMLKRPGDIPEFMCCMVAAADYEKNRFLVNTLNAILGPEPPRCVPETPWVSRTSCWEAD